MFFIKKIFSKTYKTFKKVFSLFYVREKSVILVLSLVIFVSVFVLSERAYLYFTKEIPVSGGAYSESIVGQPKTINPLFSSSNIPDRAISSLVYSGLTKVDEKGNIVSDLAEGWEVKEDGKQFIFKLRKNVKWHDGEPLLSHDVRYMVSIIQDPDYIGPLKNLWRGVSIETPDEYTVVFNLPSPQPFFIYNTTLGILPQNIWAEINIADIPYIEHNLRPIGSGMYKFKDITTDEENFIKGIALEKNDDFYSDKPFIESITFKFYKDSNEAVDALNKKQVMGTGDVSFENYPKLKKTERLRIFSYALPGYKAVFF